LAPRLQRSSARHCGTYSLHTGSSAADPRIPGVCNSPAPTDFVASSAVPTLLPRGSVMFRNTTWYGCTPPLTILRRHRTTRRSRPLRGSAAHWYPLIPSWLSPLLSLLPPAWSDHQGSIRIVPGQRAAESHGLPHSALRRTTTAFSCHDVVFFVSDTGRTDANATRNVGTVAKVWARVRGEGRGGCRNGTAERVKRV